MKTNSVPGSLFGILLVAVLVGLIAVVPAVAVPAGAPLRIGIIPFYTPEKIFSLYSPFVDYLNRTTPYRWELVLGDTHAELMDKLVRSELDIAMLGPIPFAQVRKRAPIRPLLLSLTPSGETHYHSIIVTADPSIGSLAQLKGRPFAIFPGSTAAHYLPLSMMAEEGLSPDPASLVKCTSQDRLVTCVLTQDAAAGGIKEALLRQMNDPRLKVLKTSRPLPQFVFAASPEMQADAGDSFVTVLLGLKPLVKQSDRDAVKGWDVEIVNGFALPQEDFVEQTSELLDSVAPFLK